MKHPNSWRCLPVVLASLVSLLLVSYADYITGFEVLFFLFYFVPVSLCGWCFGWRSTLAMAVLSGVSWFLVDKLSGHIYPHEGIRYWNGIICFIAFAVVGLIVVRLRWINAEQIRVREQLVRTLEDLNRSTEEIRKLQNHLQVVCAWTKRIRINDEWVDMDKFLADNLQIPISHGISPEALEEFKKSIGGDSPGPERVE
jgi:hypothetical protein